MRALQQEVTLRTIPSSLGRSFAAFAVQSFRARNGGRNATNLKGGQDEEEGEIEDEEVTLRTIPSSLGRSFAAFAVQSFRARQAVVVPVAVIGTTTTTTTIAWAQCCGSHRPSRSFGSSCFPSRLFSTIKTTTMVDFEPPEPPGTHGTPVFPDIDLSALESTSVSAAGRSSAGSRYDDPGAVFVVTGASRGLGREFVRQLLTQTKGTVIACCRNVDDCADLWKRDDLDHPDSRHRHDRVQVLQLDLEEQATIEAVGAAIRDRFTRVDLLLNVAGILGDGTTTTAGPERTITGISRGWLERSMAINVVGPVMLTKELMPLLKQKPRHRSSSSSSSNQVDTSKRNNKEEQERRRPPSVVVNLSARVGSISDNQLGGWYSYRMSKAALNQATRTLALELRRHHALAIALHPGTTDTDLSKPFQKNVKPGTLFPVDFTVRQLLRVIDAAKADHSGGLYDWAGKSISF